MYGEKIEWYGEIPADVKWLTFADQRDKGYEYDNPSNAHKITASTDDNGGLPYDDIKFKVDYNNEMNSRTCEVEFTQKGGETKTCKVTQKAPHKLIPTGKESAITYVESVSVTPDDHSCNYNETEYQFSASYTATPKIAKQYYWSDSGESSAFYDTENLTDGIPINDTDVSNFEWEKVSGEYDLDSSNGKITFSVNDDKNNTRTFIIKGTYKNHIPNSSGNYSDEGSIIQDKNGDVYHYKIDISPSASYTWEWDEVDERSFTIESYYTLNDETTKHYVDFQVDDDTSNDFNWRTSDKTIYVKPTGKNDNSASKKTANFSVRNNGDTITISLAQNANDIKHYKYQLTVVPVSLDWSSDKFGSDNGKTFTVDSEYKEFLNGQEPSTWSKCPYTLNSDSVSNFEIVKVGDDNYHIYPKNENTDRINDIVESFIVSQTNQANQDGVNDNEPQSQKVTLTQYAKDLIIFKSDYLRLTYSWEGDADVDTITVINSKIGVKDDKPSSSYKFSDYSVGYNRPSSDYSSSEYTTIKPYLQYGGDTKTSGEEGVLINFKNLLNYITTHSGDTTSDGTNVLDSLKTSDDKYQIEIDIYANVFSGQTTALPNVSYTSFIEQEGLTPEIVIDKDKHHIDVKNCITPEGGEGKDEINVFSKGAPNAYNDKNYPKYYTKVAVIYYDIETGICRMKTNKSGYFENGKGYKGNIELISNNNVIFNKRDTYNLTYRYFSQYISNITTFGSNTFPLTGGTITFEVKSKDSDGNNVDFNVKKAFTFDKDLIDFDNGITIDKPNSKDENYKVTIELGDSKIHSSDKKSSETIRFTQIGYENYCLQTDIWQLVYPSDDYVYDTLLTIDTYFSSIDKYAIINNDGSFLQNYVDVISFKEKQGEKKLVPYTLTTTIGTLSLNNKTFTPTDYSLQKHEISNSVPNNNISDVTYGITLTQEESNKTEDEPNMIMQLGTYTFKVSSDDETKNTYLASVLSVSSDGLSKEVKFNVTSKDDKGNNVGFTLSYNSENGYVSATTNEIDAVIVNCKSNTVNEQKTFTLTLTQNNSNNKRYIVIVLSGKPVSSNSKEKNNSEQISEPSTN